MSLKTGKAWQTALQTLIAAGTLTLVGCGGGDNVNITEDSGPQDDGLAGDSQTPGDELRSHEGVLISQRSIGAQLCFDINKNQRCDTLEPSDTAAANGGFTLTQDKVVGAIIAELPANGTNPALRLYADYDSPTVSALTTVFHWSKQAQPNVSVNKIADDLMQLLTLEHLDWSPPLNPNDSVPTEDQDQQSDTSESDQANEPPVLVDPPLERHALVRQSIEYLITKVSTAAESDALAAGLDPGMDENGLLLGLLVADQSLQLLPTLADALNGAADPDPQSLVDALPAIVWPADDIVLAMQMFAGDPPIETDPIALLQAKTFELFKVCTTETDCEIFQNDHVLDSGLNFSTTHYVVMPDGSREIVNRTLGEDISNLVLAEDGQWKMFNTSGMANVTRRSETIAVMTDKNNDSHDIRATSRDVAQTPVAPLLYTIGLTSDDFSTAQQNFGENAKLITLQKEQINSRYEMLYRPSEDTINRASAAQALMQAEITLQHLDSDIEEAKDTLRDAETTSQNSDEIANATEAELSALIAASESIESASTEAQSALDEANIQYEALEESIALVAAYESVLQDAEEKVVLSETENAEAQASLAAADSAYQTAAIAFDEAKTALNEALAEQESEAEESVESELNNESNSETASEEGPEITAARAEKLQARRNLIVAEANLAEATNTAEDSATALENANEELDNASIALAEAQLNPLNAPDALQAVQDAELLVSANEANLSLIDEQIVEAELAVTTMTAQSVLDEEHRQSAQNTLDELTSQFAIASDDLADAQATAALVAQESENSGCGEALPQQSIDNYNCIAVERRIGNSPTKAVSTLSELTTTNSTLTLLELHPSYAITFMPSGSTRTGSAAWHEATTVYDEADTSSPQSTWTKQKVNGVDLITVKVPAALQETGQATELLMVEHDSYVRPGIVTEAGKSSTETLLNQEALDAILP